MKTYLNIVKNIHASGITKTPVRKKLDGTFEPVDGGVRTIGLPNVIFSHNLQEGFPLLTCRKMPWQSIRVELEGFIKGITSKRWYQDRKCFFWNEWCNPEKIPDYMNDDCKPEPKQHTDQLSKDEIEDRVNSGVLRKLNWAEKKDYMAKENDLGPVYGYQWRHFGETYQYNTEANFGDTIGMMYDNKQTNKDCVNGTDQLKSIVNTLQNNYNDRRMVCSAWNPNLFHQMALAPCHTQFNLVAYGDTLNLNWSQRSCDLMLGVPANISSYSLLLCLLAKVAGLKPGNVTGLLGDCHIYENQLEGVRLLLEREPKDLPILKILDPYNTKDFDIFKWTYTDVQLLNYNPHPSVKFGDVVV